MPFGVYLHVPFCRSRCDYCAFATWTDRDHLVDAYLEACRAELETASATEALPAATSVFVGGGTPSRLPAERLGALVGAVPVTAGAEVTVECNPEDATAARFASWRAAGVNRVSFGVQSMDDEVLGVLGRRHGAAASVAAVALAGEAGFESCNVDLIFGAAGETDASWTRTLEAVLDLRPRPPHVSCYALTVEPGTPLAADRRRHPDDDTQARRYERADAVLTAAGYRWYEVSNWARPGYECRHNRLYWSQGDYRGIGCAAHSHRSGRRWWNVRTPERYIAAVASGGDPTAGEEVLDPERRASEALMLALRTRDGVPAWAVPADPDLDGLVRCQGGRAVLTRRGRLLANEVAARLVAAAGTAPVGRRGAGERTTILPG